MMRRGSGATAPAAAMDPPGDEWAAETLVITPDVREALREDRTATGQFAAFGGE